MKPRVLCLLGRAGSGKSTVAKHLSAVYGAQEHLFAMGLKHMCRDMFAFSEEQVFGSQEVKEAIDPRYNFSPRTMMQNLGSAARQHIGPDVWIRACLNGIEQDFRKRPGCPLYVISDCRHINEAATLYGYGARVLKLVCRDAPPASNPNHPSEREVDEVDPGHIHHTIHHARTDGLDFLFREVEAFLLDWFSGLRGQNVAS